MDENWKPVRGEDVRHELEERHPFVERNPLESSPADVDVAEVELAGTNFATELLKRERKLLPDFRKTAFGHNDRNPRFALRVKPDLPFRQARRAGIVDEDAVR